ncbi:MAG: hypothetical protein ABIA63_06650 [bacterium]
MARNNYSYEKYRKDQARKKKKEEKRLSKLNKKKVQQEEESVDTASGEGSDESSESRDE